MVPNERRWKRLCFAVIAVAGLCLPEGLTGAQPSKGKTPARASATKEEKPAKATGAPAASLTPAVFLIRDPAVLADLKLTSAQAAGLAEFARTANEEGWRFRDYSPEPGPAAEAAARVNDLVESNLKKLLTQPQYDRLEQIVLQVQGPSAILWPRVAERLALSANQQEKIDKLCLENQTAVKALREEARQGKNPAEIFRQNEKLRSNLQKDLVAVLTSGQRERWIDGQGKPIDLSKLEPLLAQAPELRDVEAWINSEPLTLGDLRGRVVVVHFWTFGCINCIHNYPPYKRWQEEFAGKKVTLLGIHAPETEGEKVVESIRQKAKQNGLEFPIAVDGQLKNWQAWSNNMWPAVYLVDKKGRVRYWWYGELNWEGSGGEKFMHDKIVELLAEK